MEVSGWVRLCPDVKVSQIGRCARQSGRSPEILLKDMRESSNASVPLSLFLSMSKQRHEQPMQIPWIAQTPDLEDLVEKKPDTGK